MAYSLRQLQRKNYRDLADIKLPPARKELPAETLYPVEVVNVDKESGHVKVHNVGYDAEFDEWKQEEDIVLPELPVSSNLAVFIGPAGSL